MRVLNSVIDGVSSIGWGIALAVIVTLLLYLIIYAMCGATKRFSIISWAVGGILLILLSIQCSLLVGSIKVKNTCSDVAALIDSFIPSEGVISRDNVKDAIAKASKQVPFVANIVDTDEIETVDKDGSIGDAVMHKAHVYLDWYVFRRACWIIGFCIVAGVLITQTLERAGTKMLGERRRSASPSYRRRG